MRSSLIRPSKGFSMTEMLAVVAIIGVLSHIAITSYKNLGSKSKDILHGNFVSDLNTSLRNFEQQNWSMEVTADDASTDDEFAVLRTLQWKDPTPGPNGLASDLGAPYYRQDWNPVESSDEDEFRIRWKAGAFQMLSPGDEGMGLRYSQADFTTNYAFPADFEPAGR